MKPLLEDPARPWKKGAITWRAGQGNQVAIQTEHFRLNKRVDTGFLELYDHRVDPNEWKNLAADPAMKKIIAEHRKWLPKINADPLPGSAGSDSPLYGEGGE